MAILGLTIKSVSVNTRVEIYGELTNHKGTYLPRGNPSEALPKPLGLDLTEVREDMR